VVLGGGAVSFERGTPVSLKVRNLALAVRFEARGSHPVDVSVVHRSRRDVCVASLVAGVTPSLHPVREYC
jgi:hypothetical protein